MSEQCIKEQAHRASTFMLKGLEFSKFIWGDAQPNDNDNDNDNDHASRAEIAAMCYMLP